MLILHFWPPLQTFQSFPRQNIAISQKTLLSHLSLSHTLNLLLVAYLCVSLPMLFQQLLNERIFEDHRAFQIVHFKKKKGHRECVPRLMSKFDQGIAQTIRAWLATLLPKHATLLLSNDSFYDVFKSGEILCEYVKVSRLTPDPFFTITHPYSSLANHFRPGCIPASKIHKGNMAFKQRVSKECQHVFGLTTKRKT